MLRPLTLVVLSLHINVIQAPSLLLLPLSNFYDFITRSKTASNPFRRAFVAYNWFTQRLFVSVLVLAHWSPWKPLELIVYDNEVYQSAPMTRKRVGSQYERCVIMANHQTQLDWMYFWLATWHRNNHGSFRIMLKDSLKWVPVFGWGMHFFSFIYVSRNWLKDERALLKQVSKIRDSCMGYFWLFVFPEGTIISPDTLEKARSFSEKNNLVCDAGVSPIHGSQTNSIYNPTRVLIPRYKALWTCLKLLTSGKESRQVQSLLDVTMAFEPAQDVTKHVYPEKVFSPKNVYLPDGSKGKGPPERVHIGMQLVEREEWIGYVEKNQEERFDLWLQKRWRRKESELELFQQTRQLGGNQKGDGQKLVVRIVPSFFDVVSLGGTVAAVWLASSVLIRQLTK